MLKTFSLTRYGHVRFYLFFFIIKIKMYTILISLLQIEDVIMVEDLKTWQTLIGQHDSLVWKLERSKVSNLSNM